MERTAKLKADVPQFKVIISKTWGNENEMKQLKSELAVLDSNTTIELAPKHDENNGMEVKQKLFQQNQQDIESTTIDSPLSLIKHLW